MSSPKTDTPLAFEHQQILLRVAAASIEHGLSHRKPLMVDPGAYPAELRAKRATFVTIEIEGTLRGCIGTLEATQPLVVDVAQNAYAAAFHEPRFLPLTMEEFRQIDIHISLLHPPVPMPVGSEKELIDRVRPGIDGLILEERGRRGTLLPSAWDSLPTPTEFVEHLKLKAGLPPDYWSCTLRIHRYTTEVIPSEPIGPSERTSSRTD